MLIECLIEREGGTPVQVGQTRLFFCHRPELTQGDTQANVCEVNMKEIWEHLLGIPSGNFVRYVKGSDYGGRKHIKTWEEMAQAKESAPPANVPVLPEEEVLPVLQQDVYARILKLEDENLTLKAELAVADRETLEIINFLMPEPPEGWAPLPTVSGKLSQISNLLATPQEGGGEVTAPPGLTKEIFATTKNAPKLKSLIMKCGDAQLLIALGDEEDRTNKRKWVLEALDTRLKELGA